MFLYSSLSNSQNHFLIIKNTGRLFSLAKLLAQVGCTQIWVGGSLTIDKEHPNDFDGCFDRLRRKRSYRLEIDWYSSQLDPLLINASEQEKRFGGSLVAGTMFHFQTFLKQEQQIQRYETNNYHAVGFDRLQEVMSALDVTVNKAIIQLRNR